MSASKNKFSSNSTELFQVIEALLISIKSKINDSKRKAPTSICAELHELGSLAESFTKQRPRSTKDWVHLADTLDREGVNLWNTSSRIREASDDASQAITAALRLAGFRLVEAGLPQKPGIETLIRVLQLASKAGASLSGMIAGWAIANQFGIVIYGLAPATGSNDLAGSILTSAAKYEEVLRKAEDPEKIYTQARAHAIVVYFSSRMEAAWREGNHGIAEFMSQKIIENEHLSLLPPRDQELLAAKLLEIGKSLLRPCSQSSDSTTRGHRARDSLKWLQKAFSIVEHVEENGIQREKNLKRSILRSLARAYFLSSSEVPENMVRAEASLNELISSIDTSEETTGEYQQLRWMRIAVLKKREAAPAVLLDAFQSIIDHMALSESNITDVLQEMRCFGQEHALVTAVHQHCLRRVLDAVDSSQHGQIDRLLLSLIFHCSKDTDHARAILDLTAILTCLTDAHFELSRVSATACLTLIWQFGDRQYQARHWSEAAEWYLAGTHKAFGKIATLSNSKCFRKAALCHIQQCDYAKATAVIHRCPNNEAATHYINLLIAVRQGLQDEAISAVKALVTASDFNQKMLLLATRLANESDMKSLLLSVLEALLDTVVKAADGKDIDLEVVTLIRCIIRLVLKLMAEPGSDQMSLILVLLGHFNSARMLLTSLDARQSVTKFSKDISWLWRSAYNCAIQGCSEWPNSEESVAELFDIARQLLEVYNDTGLINVDVDTHIHIIKASFAAIAGRVFAIRRQATDGSEQAARLKILWEDIKSSKKRIRAIVDAGNILGDEEISRAESFLHVLRVFEAEILCQSKEWEELLRVVEEVVNSNALIVDTLEAITDILWVDRDCPVDVLFTALEAILHASLDRSSLSIDKFSRWLRAICSMLLSRNAAADRGKAIGYVEQAIHVLESHPAEAGYESEGYPLDERQWLLGTSYNTGIECLHASLLDEAKRWFEASTAFCRFLPDGASRAERISETYSQLLERYTS